MAHGMKLAKKRIRCNAMTYMDIFLMNLKCQFSRFLPIKSFLLKVITESLQIVSERIFLKCHTYAYYPVNVSRAIGPRIVDRVILINNLSNDLEI